METDKFEQHIRTKLNEREITPSKKAWSKISEQLDVNSPSKKSGYFWMGIAASVLVLLGTVLVFLNSDVDELNIEIEVVEVPSEKVLNKINTETQRNIKEDDNEMIVSKSNAKSPIEVVTSDEVVLSTREEKEFIILKNDVAASDALNKEINDSFGSIVLSEAVLDEKIAEVLAQVDAMELNANITDAEVDSLLQNAQQDIIRENLFNQNHSVNAMALLTQVEEELDQSFRDQIFESLKTGFLKVRTAVADRNN